RPHFEDAFVRLPPRDRAVRFQRGVGLHLARPRRLDARLAGGEAGLDVGALRPRVDDLAVAVEARRALRLAEVGDVLLDVVLDAHQFGRVARLVEGLGGERDDVVADEAHAVAVVLGAQHRDDAGRLRGLARVDALDP